MNFTNLPKPHNVHEVPTLSPIVPLNITLSKGACPLVLVTLSSDKVTPPEGPAWRLRLKAPKPSLQSLSPTIGKDIPIKREAIHFSVYRLSLYRYIFPDYSSAASVAGASAAGASAAGASAAGAAFFLVERRVLGFSAALTAPLFCE